MPCTTRSILGVTLAASMTATVSTSAAAFDTFPTPSGWPAFTAARDAQEQIGPGVSYEHWRLTTAPAFGPVTNARPDAPLSISIVTVDLTNPFVSITAGAQGGSVQGRGARLSTIADSVQAEAGINGDYFDIGASNAPINALVVGGRTLHQPSAGAVFAVDLDGHLRLGPLAWRAIVTPAGGAPLTLTTVNDWSATMPLTLLTAELGNTSAYGATEAVLQPTGQSGVYEVASVGENLDSLVPLSTGQFGVAGHGSAATLIASTLTAGQRVVISYDGDPPPNAIRTAVGGGPLLIRGGAPYDDPAAPAPQEKDVRYPSTGAGVSSDGHTLWLVVVDGRRPSVSVGVTRPMLGALFAALGASDAMAFDSGGSSEMVVRHLGDPGVGVVNTPSDGRERAIADGLFILNSAPVGPASQLILRTETPAVLVGSRLVAEVEAIDQNLQPVALPPSSLSWQIDPSNALSIDVAGNLNARNPGTAKITVTAGAISTTSTVDVVPSVVGLTIKGFGTTVPAGTTAQLTANATDTRGRPVAVDQSAVTWSASRGASISPAGALTAGPVPAAVTVRAVVGATVAAALINVGDHLSTIARLLTTGNAVGAWHLTPSSNTASGALEQSPAPDGFPSTRLTYTFSAGSGTRAVYAVDEVAVAGEPIAIACDVYGDGNGAWLRASYRNADGIVDSVTLARRVDWTGWRTLRASVSPEVRWPITMTRVYVVQPNKNAAQGAIWLRNLAAVYPGP